MNTIRTLLAGIFLGAALLLGLVAPSDAAAQTCPAGATTVSRIDNGARVRLVGLHRDDAYYSMRGSMTGLSGTVSGDLHSNDGCWMGGGLNGDDGTYYYFYKAAFEYASAPAASCPAGSVTVSRIDNGVRVKLVGLHPDDAYYSMAGSMIGTQGAVSGDLHSNDGCWMGGGFNADDGTYYYFYKGAFAYASGGSPVVGSACPSGAETVSRFDGGVRVKLLGLHPDDAYYSMRGTMIGLNGTVSGDLHSNDGCWMGGGMNGDDGTYYYFYKAAFSRAAGGASCPSGAVTVSRIDNGVRVKLVGLHPDDAYYAMRGGMERVLSGTVSGDLHTNDGCWMGGGLNGDDGTYYYFYKAAFEYAGGGGTPGGDRFQGGGISSGARFRIVALHSDDAYYPDRATIIGKRCTASEYMPSQATGWYSGPAYCTDGSSPYFFKVGVVLE